jgi:hypothetical protein
MNEPKTLYSVTGNIEDLNTLLVPRAELAVALKSTEDTALLDFVENDKGRMVLSLVNSWYSRPGPNCPITRHPNLRDAVKYAIKRTKDPKWR